MPVSEPIDIYYRYTVLSIVSLEAQRAGRCDDAGDIAELRVQHVESTCKQNSCQSEVSFMTDRAK